MPHPARWVCKRCGRQLGAVLGRSLDVEPGPRVIVDHRGGTVLVTVVCPDCQIGRQWEAKRSA